MRLPVGLVALVIGFAILPRPALAQDDEDLLGEEEDEAPAPPRPDDDEEEIRLEDDESELDKIEPGEGGDDDLLGGDGPAGPRGEGADTEKIYRAYADELEGTEPDEELQAWEEYLEDYPNSFFKDRIEKRMEELEEAMYAERIERPGGEDADEQEILLSRPLQLENINPRDGFQAGFEWGLPNYINLFVDYEKALRRDLSVHGALRHRYTGWRIETGVRYAFVKSTRTQTVVTVLGDIHFNTLPAFPVLRPQLAAGKKFGDLLDVQLQAGVEVDTRGKAGVRWIGGANVTVYPSENVAFFAETGLYMQSLKTDIDPMSFRFNTGTFGLKFYPEPEGIEPRQLEVNLGASVPYSSQYWMFHFGSIMGQVNYYFD